MTKTTDLLDAAKAASGCETDYQFAKKAGWTLGRMSMYRTGKRSFDDEAAAQVAGILGREPGEIMALCHAEREKTEAGRSRWLRVAALLAAMVAAGPGQANNVGNGPVLDALIANYPKLKRLLSGRALMLA